MSSSLIDRRRARSLLALSEPTRVNVESWKASTDPAFSDARRTLPSGVLAHSSLESKLSPLKIRPSPASPGGSLRIEEDLEETGWGPLNFEMSSEKYFEDQKTVAGSKLEVTHIESQEPHRHVDLAHNVNARIQNPLYGLSREQLQHRVSKFVAQHNMEDEALFQKAAILAQNPKDWETQESLTEEDRYHLRREITNKWSQPMALYMTVVCCSLAAAVQGWDQTGSNGANLSFPTALGIPTTAGAPNAERNEWIVGVINSAPYLACAGFSCWMSDPLNNWLGRRGTIFFCGIFCTISVIGSAFAQTWPQLFICRLLLGVGMGPKASTAPVFAAENVPASIRGGLVMSWQLWTAFGIFLGFCSNAAVLNTGTIAWRLQLGSAFIPAVPMTISIFFCPESPRWLMKKNKYNQAMKSFLRLRNSPIQAARELFFVHCQLEEEHDIINGRTYFNRLTELFTVPRIRRATLASFVVMLAQQMCGINIIAFYSSTIFANAGYSDKQALFASIGFGAVNFVFAFPAIFTIDTFGRRALLLLTFPNMAWTLLAAGFCFYIPETSKAHLETMQRTLEELDYVFAVPTATHANYQMKKSLPYFFRRYLLCDKKAKLEPLYNFDEVESITHFEKGSGH
ncbi:sugar transporter [Phaffia rhodozyma]|uniref:Sugar transporter n=1 Tax=Phaffia rhodozyma TaxID=264483 RepID=A0A0F7SJ42_PHARH|nr:sugar transporter [Phaffia rhodozyma]